MNNEGSGDLQIRNATPADAEAIVRTHYAAVHGIAAAFYPPEIIEAWSRTPDEARHAWMREIVTRREDIVLVAENDRGILGFGVLTPGLRELRALYVHPQFDRGGVGGCLLREIEARAIECGIASLHLNASLNAESFYCRYGYSVVSRGTFPLSSEHEMNCVRMEKILANR